MRERRQVKPFRAASCWLIGAAIITPAAGLGASQVLSWIPGAPPLAVPTTAVARGPAPADDIPIVARGQSPSALEATALDAVESGADAVPAERVEPLPDEIRWFNGRPIRATRSVTLRTTAYSPDERSCGRFADGITASGYSVWTNGMKLVAADTKLLPFGTLLSIPGYDDGRVVPVLDRGGRIKGHRLDVLYPTHEQARKWGVQSLEVIVWEYADGQPPDFRSRPRR